MIKFIKNHGIFIVLLIVICFAVLIPINPNQMHYTYRDSGVFLYTGLRITEGELPYRDVWDHKPPMIFYINALGLMLTNGSRWGVWIIECVSLLVTTMLGYYFFQKLFNKQTAYITMFIFIASIHFVLTGGNLTNEYALPLQMITLVMLLSLYKQNLRKEYWILFGVLAALAFFTKQTTISLWIAILIFHAGKNIYKRDFKKWFTEVSFFVLGGGFISGIIIAYFWINNGLVDFFNDAIKFNYVYASLGKSIIERINSFSINFSPISLSGILILAILGIVYVIFLMRNNVPIIEENKPIFIIALISLPIEIFFISLSGRGFSHYFISIIPLLSIFSGLTFWLLFTQFEEFMGSSKHSGIVSIFLSILVSFGLYQPYMNMINSYQEVDNSCIIKYIDEITTADDTVLIWGAETKIYYFSNRMSPTKYVYLQPLYTQNYANEERIIEFLDDIIANQPKIILDTQSSDMQFLSFRIESPEIDKRIDWIKNNYYEMEPLENWIVYKHNPK